MGGCIGIPRDRNDISDDSLGSISRPHTGSFI